MPTCRDIAELAPAYALGALDEGEAHEIERHIDDCAACLEIVQADRSTAELLSLAPIQRSPSGRLGPRIMAAARLDESPHPKLFRRLFPVPSVAYGAATLATAAFVITLGWGLSLQSRLSETPPAARGIGVSSPDYEAASWTIARAQMHRLVGSPEAPEARGWIYVDPSVGEALLVAYRLPPLQPGRAYQLWLIEDGQRLSGGVFDVDHEGYGWLKVKSPRPIAEFAQVGITIEPSDGSSDPTGQRVLGGSL